LTCIGGPPLAIKSKVPSETDSAELRRKTLAVLDRSKHLRLGGTAFRQRARA
jgi:hypothetical protein